MSRDYISYLIFEDTLDAVPFQPSPRIKSLSERIFNPTTKVVMDDCGTTVGERHEVKYSLLGHKEGTSFITRARLNQLFTEELPEGKVHVRSTSTCIASGGVCLECLKASYQEYVSDAPDVSVGSTISIEAKLPLLRTYGSTDVDGIIYFSSSVAPEGVYLYDAANGIWHTEVYFDYQEELGKYRAYCSPGMYEITDCVVQPFLYTNKPFYNYLCDSYSGSLLGVKSIPTVPLPLTTKLLTSLCDESLVTAAHKDLATRQDSIPEMQFDYVEAISDPLEKAIYIIMLYSVYSNISP